MHVSGRAWKGGSQGGGVAYVCIYIYMYNLLCTHISNNMTYIIHAKVVNAWWAHDGNGIYLRFQVIIEKKKNFIECVQVSFLLGLKVGYRGIPQNDKFNDKMMSEFQLSTIYIYM